MPKIVDSAIRKCMNSMMKEGLSAKEAKSRCIGRLKNTGHLQRSPKGGGLKRTKKKFASEKKKK